LVTVGGIAEPKASTLVAEADPVHLEAAPDRYVGRGGLKLQAALETFPVEVAGRTCVDVGASTGGFTDCLLQHGAASVTAVDVGYGQLDWRIRQDPKVTVFERMNIRTAPAAEIGAPFEVVVADLSFISLRTVSPQLAALGTEQADWIVLVKPQFEIGKDRVPRGGVVRDRDHHAEAIRRVIASLAAEGLGPAGVVASPISGAEGNREFLLWERRGSTVVTEETIERVVGR
jgi:23S rRNA (cytidine1920-2'-O)/16S rRNA (cytidine1409-2'-O)-methyltransferase